MFELLRLRVFVFAEDDGELVEHDGHVGPLLRDALDNVVVVPLVEVFVPDVLEEGFGELAHLLDGDEDLGPLAELLHSPSPRQHMRYLEPLLIPLLAVMLDTLDEPPTQMRRRVLAALTALWGVGFVLVCRAIGAGAGDNTLLQWFDFVADRTDRLPVLGQGAWLAVWRAVIPVSVEMKGNAGNIKSEVFEYALEPADENSSTEAVFSEVEVTQEGITKGSFEEMRYKRPGDYKYTVYQLKGESKDVIYDGSVYEVTVRVVNTQEGGLAAEVWAVKDQSDQKTDEIKFINQYKETTTATTEAINNTIHHTTTNTITESSIGTSSPKTGDKSNVMLWGGIAILSGLCVFFFLFAGKRRKTEE